MLETLINAYKRGEDAFIVVFGVALMAVPVVNWFVVAFSAIVVCGAAAEIPTDQAKCSTRETRRESLRTLFWLMALTVIGAALFAATNVWYARLWDWTLASHIPAFLATCEICTGIVLFLLVVHVLRLLAVIKEKEVD